MTFHVGTIPYILGLDFENFPVVSIALLNLKELSKGIVSLDSVSGPVGLLLVIISSEVQIWLGEKDKG